MEAAGARMRSSATSPLHAAATAERRTRPRGIDQGAAGVRVGRKAPAVDTHHLVPQESANASGRIEGFHKNHGANLMPLCKACHDAHHNGDDVAQRRALSVTGGTVLMAYNPE